MVGGGGGHPTLLAVRHNSGADACLCDPGAWWQRQSGGGEDEDVVPQPTAEPKLSEVSGLFPNAIRTQDSQCRGDGEGQAGDEKTGCRVEPEIPQGAWRGVGIRVGTRAKCTQKVATSDSTVGKGVLPKEAEARGNGASSLQRGANTPV
eukprot:GGOE01024312.1.p3 GENE.GGOE01024312.1~~GGOE01024312.1.p3  ORF type:complete len:149 (-),score=8.32 GGOE01024312.1:195-641(-)